MVQAGQGPRFALEPLPQVLAAGEALGQDFIMIATVRSSRGSLARYTSPIPPLPINARIS